MTTPHHEDLVVVPFPCGRAVDKNGSSGSGFDQGRRAVWTAFTGKPGHTVTSYYQGNTQNFKQCDGDLAGSDGTVVEITIPSASH